VDSRPVFLVGFMGSGKSWVGRALARRLGWEFHDTDALVEQREGATVAQIIRERGEAHFRRLEWSALRDLDPGERTVVATGGGLFARTGARRFMRQRGRSVWLDCTLEAARRRSGGGQDRPLWDEADPAAFRAFFERRRAVYALAEIRIDAASDDPEEVAGQVLDRL